MMAFEQNWACIILSSKLNRTLEISTYRPKIVVIWIQKLFSWVLINRTSVWSHLVKVELTHSSWLVGFSRISCWYYNRLITWTWNKCIKSSLNDMCLITILRFNKNLRYRFIYLNMARCCSSHVFHRHYHRFHCFVLQQF